MPGKTRHKTTRKGKRANASKNRRKSMPKGIMAGREPRRATITSHEALKIFRPNETRSAIAIIAKQRRGDEVVAFSRPLTQNNIPSQFALFELDRQPGRVHIEIKKLSKAFNRKGRGSILQSLHINLSVRQALISESTRKLKKPNLEIKGFEDLDGMIDGVNRALERARGRARLETPFRITR